MSSKAEDSSRKRKRGSKKLETDASPEKRQELQNGSSIKKAKSDKEHLRSPKPENSGTPKKSSGTPTKPPAAAAAGSADPPQPAVKRERKRHKSKKSPDGKETALVAATSANAKDDSLKSSTAVDTLARKDQLVESKKSKEKKEKKEKKDKKADKITTAPWYMSEPVGGRFISTNALLTPDESYLIAATKRTVNVYSAATSELALTITPSEGGSITGFAFSGLDANNIYIATESGKLSLWDWTVGKELKTFLFGVQVLDIKVCLSDNGMQDIVYLHAHSESAGYTLSACQIMPNTKNTPKLYQLLRSDSRPQSLQILLYGKVIAVATERKVFLGQRQKSAEFLSEVVYTWWEVQSSRQITCVDCSASPTLTGSAPTPRKSSMSSQQPTVNLAIGDITGSISIYEDVLRKLSQLEFKSESGTSSQALAPRMFKWHRTAVFSVRWSLDGNYLISGGRETVLLLWQLETGKRQELPHLTSPILNITISPSGESYVIHLDDNSIMVLSTSTLAPKTNISGIQAPTLLDSSILKVVEHETSVSSVQSVPMVLNPLSPHQILLAVPSSQLAAGNSADSVPASYLETFDLLTGHHVSRQALTRNFATDISMAPNGTQLREPNIKFIKISHDGNWLATVEDWTPPAKDLEPAAYDEQSNGLGSGQEEVFLKFWKWDTTQQLWTLETRIDAPHQFTDMNSSAKVFDLVAEPDELGFATIGQDGFVKVWKPKTKLADGRVVQGAKSEGSTVWTSRFVIPLENVKSTAVVDETFGSAVPPTDGKLAFSNDGSVLAAVSWSASNPFLRPLLLIDSNTGSIKDTLSGLVTEELESMAFVGRHLVLVSQVITVWDIVANDLSYCYPLPGDNAKSNLNKHKICQLAVNETHGTFIVAISHISKSPKQKNLTATSEILIFDPSRSTPHFKSRHPHALTALLPVSATKGFIALDSAAEVRIISPVYGSTSELVGLTSQSRAVASITDTGVSQPLVDQADTQLQIASVSAENEDISVDDIQDHDMESDRPIVQPQQLAEVLGSGPSFALPSVRDLFKAVVGLYARKEPARPTLASALTTV